MIGNDRIELNKRFVHVFNLLEQRNLIVKNDRNGKGMGDFAEKILGNRGYGHIIRAFLNPNDKRCFDYKHIEKMSRIYGVNEDYLMHGIGKPFGRPLKRHLSSNGEAASSMRGNILFTDSHAFAGSSVDVGSSAPEDVSYFSIPDMTGNDFVAFTIEGNSMEPLIKYGDIVICEPILHIDRIRNNEIYAIKSNGSVWVKYVQKITDSRGRIGKLKLISENKLEHDPFIEEINDYTRVYKVVRLISSL